jgi:hypothetical protein
VYLNELDYFVKFNLRERYYLRYMDDFLIFGNDKKHLTHLKELISEFLEEKLKLRLHDKKSTIFSTKDGVNFLGFRIYRDYRRIQRENVRRFVKRMKRMAFAAKAQRILHTPAPLPPEARLAQGGKRGLAGREKSPLKRGDLKGCVVRDITNSVQSWLAHARNGNTYNLRKEILPKLVFSRN